MTCLDQFDEIALLQWLWHEREGDEKGEIRNGGAVDSKASLRWHISAVGRRNMDHSRKKWWAHAHRVLGTLYLSISTGCNLCQARPECDRPNSNLRCWARFRLGLKSLHQTRLVTQPNSIWLFSELKKRLSETWDCPKPYSPQLLQWGPCWGSHSNIGASILVRIDAYSWEKLTVVQTFAKLGFLNPTVKSQTCKSSKIL